MIDKKEYDRKYYEKKKKLKRELDEKKHYYIMENARLAMKMPMYIKTNNGCEKIIQIKKERKPWMEEKRLLYKQGLRRCIICCKIKKINQFTFSMLGNGKTNRCIVCARLENKQKAGKYGETYFIIQRQKQMPNIISYNTRQKETFIFLGNIWYNVMKKAFIEDISEADRNGFLDYGLEYMILKTIINENLHRCIWILFRDDAKINEYQQGIESELIDSVICWIIEEEI